MLVAVASDELFACDGTAVKDGVAVAVADDVLVAVIVGLSVGSKLGVAVGVLERW